MCNSCNVEVGDVSEILPGPLQNHRLAFSRYRKFPPKICGRIWSTSFGLVTAWIVSDWTRGDNHTLYMVGEAVLTPTSQDTRRVYVWGKQMRF